MAGNRRGLPVGIFLLDKPACQFISLALMLIKEHLWKNSRVKNKA
jgi:hypothetical protein